MTTSRKQRVLAVAAVAGFVLASGSVASAQADDSLAPLISRSTQPIAGEYIVVLDAAASSASIAAVADAAVRAGATVGHTYTSAIKGFSASLPAAALAAVRAADGVAYVESDAFASLGMPSTAGIDGGEQPNATWGIDRVDQRNLPLNTKYRWRKSGNGVTAYVIDTGVRFSHNEFEGRAVSGPDFYDDDDDSSDCHGHGTHVSGTVGGKTYGIAKDVTIVGIRTISCGGGGVVSDSIAGVDWVVDNATTRAVMNMSLHFGYVQALNDAIADAFEEDIMFSAAAANDNQDACNDSPSSEPTAITVAASTNIDQEASFSNHGPCVDIYAPGVNILSAGISSDTATATMSGTSMAAPHVTGGLAQLLERKPGADGTRITNVLINKSSKDKITNPGPGTPNRLLFTRRF